MLRWLDCSVDLVTTLRRALADDGSSFDTVDSLSPSPQLLSKSSISDGSLEKVETIAQHHLAKSEQRVNIWWVIEAPATLAELRMLVAVKLAVAPRHLFATLAKPKRTPTEADKARDDLVEFITRDLARWQFMRVVDETTLRGHSS